VSCVLDTPVSVERVPTTGPRDDLNFGLHLSFGVYEVVWSLYLIALGATITWVGFTFVLFAVPQMIASPIAGRMVDRLGPTRFVVGGGVVILASGSVYALASEPVLPTLIVPLESVATAAMTPALFAMAAAGTPAGRASTVQGVYGALSTLALVVAATVSGVLFEEGIGYPFWFFVAGLAVCLAVGLLIYRGGRAPGPHRALAETTG
jgi:MFS transporter, DHA1 family, multidrug resistance protein